EYRPAPTTTPGLAAWNPAVAGSAPAQPGAESSAAVLSRTWSATMPYGHPPQTLSRSTVQVAGAAKAIPPNSCQRQPVGTGASGPRASTTDRGERVSVVSTRVASGPRATAFTPSAGAA